MNKEQLNAIITVLCKLGYCIVEIKKSESELQFYCASNYQIDNTTLSLTIQGNDITNMVFSMAAHPVYNHLTSATVQEIEGFILDDARTTSIVVKIANLPVIRKTFSTHYPWVVYEKG